MDDQIDRGEVGDRAEDDDAVPVYHATIIEDDEPEAAEHRARRSGIDLSCSCQGLGCVVTVGVVLLLMYLLFGRG